MNKIIKEQINRLKPSATLAINEESNKLKKSGKKVYKFGFGQSPFPVPESIVSALKNNANKNTYLPMQGLEELRSAIANQLNQSNNNDFVAEDIIVGPGTKELMLKLLLQAKYYFPLPVGFHINLKQLLLKIKFTGSKLQAVPIGFQLLNNWKTKLKVLKIKI